MKSMKIAIAEHDSYRRVENLRMIHHVSQYGVGSRSVQVQSAILLKTSYGLYLDSGGMLSS